MTDIQNIRLGVVSLSIDEIILERFFTKLEPPDMEYLAATTGWAKRRIWLLKNYDNDTFCVEKNEVRISVDNQTLERLAKEYIMHIIKKYVYTSKYEKDTYGYDIGKSVDDSYYAKNELEFVYEVYNTFIEIINTRTDNVDLQKPTDRIVLQYNSINNNRFHYAARNVYNGVIQGTLRAGDNIEKVIENSLDNNFDIKLLSIVYEWFFEVNQDSNIILRCDLDTKKEIFIMNFINTIIYRLNDNEVKNKLLRQMQIKYGLLRK